jgi:hypothetical protein
MAGFKILRVGNPTLPTDGINLGFADATYFKANGSVPITGVLTIESTSTQIRFHETDQVSPDGRYRFSGSGGNFTFAKDNAPGDWSSSTTIWQTSGVDLFTIFIPTRISGVYIGATPTGLASANMVAAANGNALNLRGGIDGAGSVVFRDASNSQLAIVDPIGVATTSIRTVMTREKGDDRYVDKVSTSPQQIAGDIYFGTWNTTTDASAARAGSLAFYGKSDTGLTPNTPYFALYRGAPPTLVFHVNRGGSIFSVTGTITVISDPAEKTELADATPKLDDLMKLRIVNYHANRAPEAGKLLGFDAPNVKSIFPGLVEPLVEVHTDEEGNETEMQGPDTVKWSVFVPMLVKALQEAVAQVRALETRLAALETA